MKLCWLYRKAISWASDSQNPPQSWVEAHVRACPDCRRFLELELRLSANLTAQANAEAPEFPPFLHGRIMAHLQTATAPVEDRPNLRWLGALLVPALGVLAVVGYTSWNRGPVQLAPAAATGASLARIFPTALSEPNSDQLLAWSEKLDLPLQSELNCVVKDAQAALKGLTDNFVPADLLAKH